MDREGIPPTPVKVSIDVTNRCNLRCRHCRISEPGNVVDALSFQVLTGVIDELALRGVFILGLSGGEPFVRADFLEILVRASSSRIPKVYVSTNASRLDDKTRAHLERLPNKVVFRVSLDGLGETHDVIRQMSGAFEQAIAGIRRLVASGRRVEVTTTLMRANLRDAADLVRLTRSLGVAKHRFISAMPVGRATAEMLLSREEARRVVADLNKLNGSSSVKHQISIEIPFLDQTRPRFTCRAGRWECAVLADGRVVGCKLMPDLIEGSVLNDSLIEIWRKRSAFAVFRNGISGGQDICPGCTLVATCRGGCRAYSRVVCGELYARDPRCPGVVQIL